MMRSQYQRALYQLVSITRDQPLPPSFQSVWPLSQPVGMDWSRYYREFDEISFIAGGGFGKVYKACHKLDNVMYAVKKITIKSSSINRVLSHLAEVKTLASLNHGNIVSYKAAWLEPLLDNEVKNENTEPAGEDGFEEETSAIKNSLPNKNEAFEIEDDSSEFIHFVKSKNSFVSVGSNKTETSLQQYMGNVENLNISSSQPHVKLKWATLFIQMTLYQLTLREWLDMRNQHSDFNSFYRFYFKNELFVSSSHKCYKMQELNSYDADKLHHIIVLDIFYQLFNGLNYIHSQGIVHHDVKPSNVFINLETNGTLAVQLGDFGLACPLQNQHPENFVGTPTYAAPEQLNGLCNPKVSAF